MNSDGNITFREGDNASTDRSVGPLLTGPPRVAPFLADLDPSAGGGVFVNAAAIRTRHLVRRPRLRLDADDDGAGDAAARRVDRVQVSPRGISLRRGGRPVARPDQDVSAPST